MTTVICVGNEMRGDDGAGLAVATGLRARGVPARVEQPSDLIDAWAGEDDVVVVDTVDSGAAPGTLHRIDAGRGPLPIEVRNGSSHLLGLGEAIELGRALGRLPSRLEILGIEGRAFECGAPLSLEAERAVAAVVDELVRRLGAGAR